MKAACMLFLKMLIFFLAFDQYRRVTIFCVNILEKIIQIDIKCLYNIDKHYQRWYGTTVFDLGYSPLLTFAKVASSCIVMFISRRRSLIRLLIWISISSSIRQVNVSLFIVGI